MSDRIKQEQTAFKRRTNRIERSVLVAKTQKLVQEIHDCYREAALQHWEKQGIRASTGWGRSPEGDYMNPMDPKDCTDEIARELTEAVLWPF